MNKIILSDDFEETKDKIIAEGLDKFHVLADFDRTLTKCFVNSEKASSIISHLRNGKYLTEDYAAKAHALFDEYHHIEINPNLPMEEKKERMKEWWTKHYNLLIESGLNKETIIQAVTDMINEGTLVLREGVEDFLQFLNEKNIPLVIMSSSIGDLIIEFLKQKNIFYDNIHVISNLLEFDENGTAMKIKEIIHVFNKYEIEVKIPEVQERKNVLLLGDSVGDLGMIEGFEYDNLLKIGFLNENVEENLEVYQDMFDVVLLGDSDFSFVNQLFE